MMNNVFQPLIEKKGGVNKACKYIANRLNNKWTWKYIYHVYRGTAKPSKKLRAGLNALRLQPPRIRHRTKVEADTQEQLDYWNSFTMEQRKEALDNMRK